jgi:hypothetical protein
VRYTGLTGEVPRCWTILSTGLTGQSNAEAAALCVRWIACIRPGGVALVQGELACVQGELFVVFELWSGGLHSSLEHSFCLGCVEPLSLPFFK